MKLATIELITKIAPIDGADKIVVATVGGWQVVVQKELHSEGDKVVFVHPDTVLAPSDWNKFLVDKGNPEAPIVLRPRTLRGTFSVGLALPLGVLPKDLPSYAVGTEVSSVLGVTKYEKPLPGVLAEHCDGYLESSVAPSTDQENGQSDLALAQSVLSGEVTITGKLDGTSETLEVVDGEVVKVYSRRVSFKRDPEQMYWKEALKLKLPKTFTGIIQGELCGPGIQSNHLGLKGREFFVFGVSTKFAKDFTESDGEWMAYEQMHDFCEKCGASIVPLLDQGRFYASELELMAEEYYYDNGVKGEGIVVTNKSYLRKGHVRPRGFKIVAKEYL